MASAELEIADNELQNRTMENITQERDQIVSNLDAVSGQRREATNEAGSRLEPDYA